MREIKFRGKINKSPEYGSENHPYRIGDWIYGFYVKARRVVNGQVKIHHNIYTEGTVIGIVDPETVGQYIEIKDKNGKENYHKDILKWEDCKFIIEWNDGKGCWYGKPFQDNNIGGFLSASSFNQSENIGNIYENPELLK